MKGDPDRELAIFIEALKLSPAERPAYLKRMCGTDEKLRRKVAALLQAYDRLGDFLEEPPNEENGE